MDDSLHEFRHKSCSNDSICNRSYSQYRQFLKCIQRIPDADYQNSSREEVRQRYRQLASETDALTIKMSLQEGKRRLAQVQSMVGYTPDSTDEDSWINTKDKEDPRGRVGVSWPWEK